MISYYDGNIFDDSSEALVNAVNTVGVMGRGVALQFKLTFPECYKVYIEAIRKNKVLLGEVQVVPIHNSEHVKYVVNFPTKAHWRNPSRLDWINDGLIDLKHKIHAHQIKTIALPALGCGNGGLNWEDVNALIQQHLKEINGNVRVYLPHNSSLC